ncbi:MAG: hypothetical protein ABSE62_09565 [Chthoniobacteraceae bacterium]
MIGGNAVILLGLPRLTLDIDLLVPESKRSQWLDLMRGLGFRLLHGSDAFAQFQPESSEMVPVDLMFVDAGTWSQLDSEARPETLADQHIRIPRPEHLVALKLHAVISPGRKAKEQDWEDIRGIVQSCRLDPNAPYFREIILPHGGQEALERIRRYANES